MISVSASPTSSRSGWAALRKRRAAAIELVGNLGREPRVIDEASNRCRRYLRSRGSLEPNLADSVVSIAASVGDEPLHRAFERAMRDAVGGTLYSGTNDIQRNIIARWLGLQTST